MRNKKYIVAVFLLILLSAMLIIIEKISEKSRANRTILDSITISEQDTLAKSRERFGVPPIEKNWVVHENSRYRVYWGTKVRGVSGNQPTHLAKTINLNEKGFPVSEDDDFHFEVNDSLAYRLVLVHNFLGNGKWEHRENEFFIYKYTGFTDVSSKMVNDYFVDSVFQEWNILAGKDLHKMQ